ncbi:MAG: HD domain-containing phosphohydrolase [Thermodesulfobacteriota bacterium]
MTVKNKKTLISGDSMLIFSVGLAIIYWLIESVIHLFVSSDVNFLQQLLGTDIYNTYTRIIILCLFVIFGSHVQYTINKKREAENALRESEEKYRKILESIEEGYYEVDPDGRFTFFNDSVCRILGVSKEELLGRNSQAYMDEPNARKLERTFHKVADTGKPFTAFDCEYIIKDGTKRIIETSVSLISDVKGRTLGFRGVARDITAKKDMEKELLEYHRKLQDSRSAAILGLAKLAEYRDRETGSHLERIREYAKIIARELSQKPEYRGYIDENYIEDIYNSAILHDIGKVAISDAILLKPEKLTPEEFETMKHHTTMGGQALEVIESRTQGQSFLTIGKEIAFNHHERWDGTGYPRGLAGRQIPLSARIVALADVYDALVSRRSYKEAMRHEDVQEQIVMGRGTQFDPDVVDAFLARIEDFRAVHNRLGDA